MKFRRKPEIVVEAMQYTGHNGAEIERWSGGKVVESPVLEPTEVNPTGNYLQIGDPEEMLTAIVGDWVMRGTNGLFCPCSADVFEGIYEVTEDIAEVGADVRERVLRNFEAACKCWGHKALPDIREAVQLYLLLCRAKVVVK
jgi:hypothetical protein